MCMRVNSAQWTYSTNMTDFNKRHMVEEQMHKAKFDKVTWAKAATFDWAKLQNGTVRRQLRMLTANTKACLSDDKYNEASISTYVCMYVCGIYYAQWIADFGFSCEFKICFKSFIHMYIHTFP